MDKLNDIRKKGELIKLMSYISSTYCLDKKNLYALEVLLFCFFLEFYSR